MENPKTNFFKTFSCLEHTPITPQEVRASKSSKLKIVTFEQKSYCTFTVSEHLGGGAFDNWCKHINSIAIDLQGDFDPSTKIIESHHSSLSAGWQALLPEFMRAIKDHKERENELECIHSISTESVKWFLLLIPILAFHRPRIYIDASNGCVNADLTTRDNGLLSTQISHNGQIHYSYVSKNKKIFKITGVAKFKDSRDLIKFNKILQML